MADQMINQLPVKTAPQTGDKFLVIGAAEEQLIDYDKLADAILTKLASKTFALDQGTKSLVAALNELNSNMSLYLPIRKTKYKELKENDDLNNFGTSPGVWFSLNGDITKTLLNRPSSATGGAILITMDITGGEWAFQLFITNGAQMFFRARNKEWKSIKLE